MVTKLQVHAIHLRIIIRNIYRVYILNTHEYLFNSAACDQISKNNDRPISPDSKNHIKFLFLEYPEISS